MELKKGDTIYRVRRDWLAGDAVKMVGVEIVGAGEQVIIVRPLTDNVGRSKSRLSRRVVEDRYRQHPQVAMELARAEIESELMLARAEIERLEKQDSELRAMIETGNFGWVQSDAP